MRQTRNILMLGEVAKRLQPLLEQLVFVGGATVDLLLTDQAAQTARPTEDVDTIIDVATKHAYDQLSMELIDLGWRNDTSSGIICRWQQDDFVLDVMPTKEDILTFSNPWYASAIQNSLTYQLEPSLKIQANSTPYFLASKMVAWQQRGEKQYLTSKDLEDILLVVDGRPEVIDDVHSAAKPVRDFIAQQFRTLLEDATFNELILGFVPSNQPQRAVMVRERMILLGGLSE